jgi:hypothetical protein
MFTAEMVKKKSAVLQSNIADKPFARQLATVPATRALHQRLDVPRQLS